MSVSVLLQRLSPRRVDLLVVVVVAWPTVMDAWWNEPGSRQADAATYLLTVAMVAPLVVRRRWPIPVAVISGSALTGLYVLGHHGELLNLPVMVALYTIAVHGDRRTTVITGVVAASWSGVLGLTSDDPIGARGGSPVLEMLWPLIPLAFGEATRSRRELLAHAEAERELEAQRRVDQERNRIAREMHDVVAHTMTAVNVQMSAAAAAFDSRPDLARSALDEARASSRTALQELHGLIGLFRGDPTSAPAPRLDQLAELTAPVRARGIAVRVDDHLDRTSLPATVELAAYRIVQEALTNVVRHTQATHVAITLGLDGGNLVVDVRNDGVDATRALSGSGGFGLTGMDERAAALGGIVTHGPTEGGFAVRATLPTDPARAAT